MPNGTRTGTRQSARSRSGTKSNKKIASKTDENVIKDTISKDSSNGTPEMGNKASVLTKKKQEH